MGNTGGGGGIGCQIQIYCTAKYWWGGVKGGGGCVRKIQIYCTVNALEYFMPGWHSGLVS